MNLRGPAGPRPFADYRLAQQILVRDSGLAALPKTSLPEDRIGAKNGAWADAWGLNGGQAGSEVARSFAWASPRLRPAQDGSSQTLEFFGEVTWVAPDVSSFTAMVHVSGHPLEVTEMRFPCSLLEPGEVAMLYVGRRIGGSQEPGEPPRTYLLLTGQKEEWDAVRSDGSRFPLGI